MPHDPAELPGARSRSLLRACPASLLGCVHRGRPHLPRCHPGRLARSIVAVASALGAAILLTVPAWADLKVCNASGGRVGLSLGYQDRDGWVTEGWWNISSQTCETLLKGGVPSRFIYVYAVDYDRGGEWAGTNYMCTHEKSFAIRGVQECQKRGYKRTGYFEVDTGDSREWTIRLTDPDDTKVR